PGWTRIGQPRYLLAVVDEHVGSANSRGAEERTSVVPADVRVPELVPRKDLQSPVGRGRLRVRAALLLGGVGLHLVDVASEERLKRGCGVGDDTEDDGLGRRLLAEILRVPHELDRMPRLPPGEAEGAVRERLPVQGVL